MIQIDTIKFLTELYVNAEGWITLWTKQDKHTAWLDVTNHQLIADTAEAVNQDIYFGVGISNQRKSEGRLSADDVTAIPGLWIDIDIAGQEHKQANLPASLSDAIQFMNSLPFEPTIIVDSGHGLHAYWLFREIWEFDTQEERNQAKGLLKGFQNFIRSRATINKWKLDATHDLSRVLRLPGTMNYKSDPVPVTVISHNDNRYNPSDFEVYAASIVTPDKRDKFQRNPSDGPAQMVIDNCKFVQACRDYASELSEPQWVAMITNISRCSDGPEVVHQLSRPYAGYSEQETQDKIFHVLNNMHPQTCQYIQETLGFSMCPEGGCGVKSPCGWALAKAKKPTHEATETLDKPVPDGFFDVDTDSTGIDKFTDLGNAERFAKMFKGELQYCKQMGKWLIWNGSRWEKDNSDQVMTYAKKCIRSMYVYAAGVDDPIFRKAILKHANSSESLKAIKSMITIAQSELPVALHDLDADQWILNCTNGIVDLKTGKLMPHDSKKNCTKMSPAVFSVDAECPVFESFIRSTFDSNENIINFMQRLLGYCLTGETREQQFAIAFGSGRNGKGTLLNLVLDIMGDYAQTTPTDTLYRKKNEGVSNDIARLMGARFVLASEGEEGKRFDEALIKKMTGQDRMAARFLHQEFFEFMPQFKIMLMTNDKPIARGDDVALWSRIQLIPFTQKFTGAKKDDTLKEKLRTPSEMSGILRWLVQGCLEWQRVGLNPPEEVVQATAEYRNESDKFQTWIDECCVIEEYAVAASSDLYRSFQAWSLTNGDKHIVTSIIFSKHLVKKGFENFKGTGGTRKFKGIGLLAEISEKQAVNDTPY